MTPSPPPSPPHLRLGRDGEDTAAALLGGKGYLVLERNYRAKGGEVDLICRDGDTLVFVEVKTRGPGSLGRPDQAVTPAKRRRIALAAAVYLSERDLWEMPCRFDVVAIVVRDGGHTATHLPNAFGVEDALDTGRFYQP